MLRTVVACLFIACSIAAFSQSNRQIQLDELLSTYDTSGNPGLSVGVVENGEIIYQKSIGYASVEKRTHINAATAFNVASIAKQFTAACIWVLIEQKKISLDDDIRKYLPEMPGYGASIKIRHLLNHTSGIRNYHAIMDLQGFDYDRDYYNDDTVLSMASRQKGLNNRPGEKVLYSNTNYNLLAIIIERISGNDLQTFAAEHLFKNIGMRSTMFRIKADQLFPTDVATGYQFSSGKFVTNTSVQESYGAGNLYASVNDLALWTNILIGNDNKFSALTTFLSSCEKLTDGGMAQYARGVMMDTYRDEKTISHSGSDWGGKAQLLVVPHKNLGIIVLSNLASIEPTAISYQILDLFIAADTSITEQSRPFAAKTNLLEFTGTYKEVNSDMRMDILIENDTLKSRGGAAKKPIVLVRTGDKEFRRKNNESVAYLFKKDRNQDMIISFGGTPFYFKRANFLDNAKINLADFSGTFYATELGTEYHFSVQDGGLFLSFPNHVMIPLFPGQHDEFGNNQRTLYHFVRNRSNRVVGMTLSSEGTVKNIHFKKR